MFSARPALHRRAKEQAESPFWVSFADLMTALMMLFLVVMAVALLAVTKTVSEKEQQEQHQRDDVDLVLDKFSEAAARYDGIKVDRYRRVIDFGDRARFAFGKSSLTAEQEVVLRRFVPEIIALANQGAGKRVLKRIVVEGYADHTGSYLSNLNLSLQRSQRVLCAMFAAQGESPLTMAQKEDVRNLFLVGGYSFNAAKASDEESRRVEMRLEFLGIGENRAPPAEVGGNFGECALKS
jgi:outer membrane protein OmpA-like peptidoglycan-associated protein